jgi:hypothetical protein
MNNTYGANATSPIEVWLSQRNMEITCRVVAEDETAELLDVDSLSMRGAQREITGYLIDQGYQPVGRWTAESYDADGEAAETVRQFKLAAAQAIA